MKSTPLLLIFVKFPEPGKVKTRLAKVLGSQGAVDVYRQLVLRVAENVVPAAGKAKKWEVWLVFDPAERKTEVQEWLKPIFGDAATRYVPQVAGDLGARLATAFTEGFAAGFEKIAAIGTDCVDLDAIGIGECWDALDETDIVFGPAEDGGYYLVALKEECPAIFEGVPWSDERTLEVSKEKAATAGLAVRELAVLSDVDEMEQWEAVKARSGTR